MQSTFFILLLPLSSIASSGLHSHFIIDSMQKCEHKVKSKWFSVWIKEIFLFLSHLFPEVVYMIVNWKCLFVYFQYNFSSTYLFLFVSIKLVTQMLNVLVVSLCKSVIHKLKMLGWVKLEYYKSVKGNHKRGEANFEISVGGSNIGAHDFWLI